MARSEPSDDVLALAPRSVGVAFGLWLGAMAVTYGAEVLARTLSETTVLGVGPEFLWAPFVDAALWTAVTVAAVGLVRRFPLGAGRWLRHGAVLVAVGFVLVPLRNVALAVPGFVFGGLRTDFDFVYLFISTTRDDLYVYGLMVLALHAVRHTQALRQREVAQARVETELAEVQLQTLKGHLQPHFLFNTLHAISTLVHDDPARAGTMIEQLSEMLRTTLAYREAQEVPLKDEVATLRPYLAIEQTRLGDRLRAEVEVAPEAERALVPHLLLQPLVENAVRHGIAPRRGPGRIRVTARLDGDDVLLRVEDDGLGMRGPVRPGSIGLATTRDRLGHLYGDAHRFAIDSAPDEGTRIEIRVPFHTTDRAA